MGFLARRLGKRLRALRGDAPLRTFSRKLGVSHTTLNRLEMGKQNVALATIEKPCVRLKCEVGDLFAEAKADRKNDA